MIVVGIIFLNCKINSKSHVLYKRMNVLCIWSSQLTKHYLQKDAVEAELSMEILKPQKYSVLTSEILFVLFLYYENKYWWAFLLHNNIQQVSNGEFTQYFFLILLLIVLVWQLWWDFPPFISFFLYSLFPLITLSEDISNNVCKF